MLNPNSRPAAALILGLGGISLGFFLLCTEHFFDASIMADKLLFTCISAASFLIPVLYIMTGFKKSALISLLFMITLASTCLLQYFHRSTLRFFFVDQKDALKILNTSRMRKIDEINQACSAWISQNGVTVLIYGQRLVSIDPSETPNLTTEMLEECKENFIAEVSNKTRKRKSEKDTVVVKFNLSRIPVKNKADEKLLAEMLDSIYFTKFKRNIIIVIRVINYKNMIYTGFGRTVEDVTEEGKKEKAEIERKLKGEKEPEEEEAKKEEAKDEVTKEEETKEKEEEENKEEQTKENKEEEETKEKEEDITENKDETKENKERNKEQKENKEAPLNTINNQTNEQKMKDQIIPEQSPQVPSV